MPAPPPASYLGHNKSKMRLDYDVACGFIGPRAAAANFQLQRLLYFVRVILLIGPLRQSWGFLQESVPLCLQIDSSETQLVSNSIIAIISSFLDREPAKVSISAKTVIKP